VTETTKAKRHTDPDVARIRAVKQAAAKLYAAEKAAERASDRVRAALDAYNDAILSAPEAQRDYLRSLAETPA